jgi:uncharacterized membrane protein
MRHGFGIEHGYFTGWSNGGTIVILILLISAVIAIIAFTRDHFWKKDHPEHNKFLEILNEKYASNAIGPDEYNERSMLIEDEYWLDADDPAMMMLKERYANCEIDSREYVKLREELKERKKKSALDILRERYAKGEISSEKFQEIRKIIQ